MSDSSHEIALLLHCANKWNPEQEWQSLAVSVKPHLQAIAGILWSSAERNRELIESQREKRLDEVVDDCFREIGESLDLSPAMEEYEIIELAKQNGMIARDAEIAIQPQPPLASDDGLFPDS